MNIEVIGRLRPSQYNEYSGEAGINVVAEGRNTLRNVHVGNAFDFQELYRQAQTTKEVYRNAVQPLIQLYTNGFNVCFMLIGEASTGKSLAVAGDELSNSPGMFEYLVEDLFNDLKNVRRDFHVSTSAAMDMPVVQMRMFEVCDDSAIDLLAASGSQRSQQLQLEFLEDEGFTFSNLVPKPLSGRETAMAAFSQAWARRSRRAVTFVQLDLMKAIDVNLHPNRSRFTLVVLPVQESLSVVTPGIRVSEAYGAVTEPNAGRSVGAVFRLIEKLATQPFANRVIDYKECELTKLLQEELGGNCKTDAMLCFKSDSNPYIVSDLFKMADLLGRVVNFPVVNDICAQLLQTQYRARVTDLLHRIGPGAADRSNIPLSDPQLLRNTQTENIMLRELNERLQDQLKQFESRFGMVALARTDISAQLLQAEEEKLQMSRNLVDAQIENNRLKEDHEASLFATSNEVITLKQTIADLSAQRDRALRELDATREQLRELEGQYDGIRAEFAPLEEYNALLSAQLNEEIERSNQFCTDVVHVMGTIESGSNLPPDLVKRIKIESERPPPRQLEPPALGQKGSYYKQFFDDSNRLRNEIGRLKGDYEDEMRKLNERLGTQNGELTDKRSQIRNLQKTISEQNAQLITVRNDKLQMETQLNRSQHKLKTMYEEFCTRLNRYVTAIANYVDETRKKSKGQVPASKGSRPQSGEMRRYADSMLKDLKAVHRAREQQLSEAAQSYRQRMTDVIKRHEEVLVAYSELRQQVEGAGMKMVDLGLPEYQLNMPDDELASRQQKEIGRLSNLLAQSQTEAESLRIRNRMNERRGVDTDLADFMTTKNDEKWYLLRKQLREFMQNTQQEQEQERAELLSENAMLQQEVKELQQYIDTHLDRYKEEILRQKQTAGGYTGPAVADMQNTASSYQPTQRTSKPRQPRTYRKV